EALRGGEVAFPKSLRDQVFALYPPNAFTAHTLLRAHLALGRFMGEAALQFLREARDQLQADAGADVRALAGAEAKADAGVESRTEVQAKSKADAEADFTEGVTAISMHGPVIYHDPPSELNQGQGGQIELGEASLVAEITGIMTLSQLRASDTAAGGHGAPLSSFADYLLCKDSARGRAIQNLGGIANVTPIYPGMKASEVISFDTGPANMVIDAVTHLLTGGEEQMDRNGARAARGQVDATLLAELLAHPYFQQSPPKTTGREMFGLPYAHDVVRRGGELGLSIDDIVATVTMLTAKSLEIA